MIGKLYTRHPWHDGTGDPCVECTSAGLHDLRGGQIMVCVGKLLPNDFVSSSRTENRLFIYRRRKAGAVYFVFYNSNDRRIYIIPEEKLHEYVVEV